MSTSSSDSEAFFLVLSFLPAAEPVIVRAVGAAVYEEGRGLAEAVRGESADMERGEVAAASFLLRVWRRECVGVEGGGFKNSSSLVGVMAGSAGVAGVDEAAEVLAVEAAEMAAASSGAISAWMQVCTKLETS